MDHSLLKPYTSFTLARIKPGRGGEGLLKEILDEIENILGLAAPNATRKLIGRYGPIGDRSFETGSLHYEERRRPPWTSDSDTIDVVNHLVVVCRRGDHVAIALTDTALGQALLKQFSGAGEGLSALEPIEIRALNAAFARGAARTLWLSGIHARTTVKADSKVLIGEDLRDALDPLGDQSYYFTAARCVTKLGKRPTPVGISPRQSRVWIGPSRSWADFQDRVSRVFDCLEGIRKTSPKDDEPFPILATPLSSPGDVSGAFDVSILAPEATAEEREQKIRIQQEELAYETNFKVVPTEGANLVAEVRLGQTLLGRLNISVDASNPAHVRYAIKPEPDKGQESFLKECVDLCKNRDWFQIRYESGHTLSGGMLYSPRLRDFHFENWRFADFSGYDIGKEKPTGKKEGRQVFVPEWVGTKDSLFCWVVNNWPYLDGVGHRRGWLASDDGAMERADFIHLDIAMDPPWLTLIHVKGAHGAGPGCSVSVSDYEVVTAQAQKNLRSLDRIFLEAGLAEGLTKRIGKLVWHDGKRQKDRTGFLKTLNGIGENLRKRVVVVQPRLSREILKSVRIEQEKIAGKKGAKPSGDVMRLMQLETLLVGAQNACRGREAEFWVIADGTPAAPKRKAAPVRTPRSRTPRRGDK